MKLWKLVLGAVAACAACCSAPIISAAAAMGLGGIGAVAASTQSWVPFVAGAVALAAGAGVVAWRRRPPVQATSCGSPGCSASCP